MASVTRSTRRAEGLHPHHANNGGPFTRAGPEALFHAPRRTNKRPITLDTSHDREFDPTKHKKPRIAVEIIAKHPRPRIDKPSQTAVKAPPTPPPAAAAITRSKPAVATDGNDATFVTTTQTPELESEATLTKHQAKVINGIKHELDRLQPAGQVSTPDSKEGGRSLRSREASRFKSELSLYFPEYDEVIGNEPKEENLFNVDTPIVVMDSHHQRGTFSGSQVQPLPQDSTNGHLVRGYGDILFTNVSDCQRIDFSFFEAQFQNKSLEDPLPDSLFEPIHKRAARLERSIRNTERGRAQHEKDQIVRLLESLQGYDWLRVMGVNGVTDTRKKSFEPARNHFIRGCQTILDKFKNWTLEEKRRKLEKDRALAEQAEDDDDDEMGEYEGEGDDGEGRSPAGSLSASPARQLREEALARSKSSRPIKRSRPQPSARPPRPPAPQESSPHRPFTSFFARRHERDLVMKGGRRAERRKILAWGHPLPDIHEEDFMLPEHYRDEETLRVRARKKRRLKRSSKQ